MDGEQKDYMRREGYNDLIDLVEDGKCPFCHCPVDPDSMTAEARKEHDTCGICQVCYDEFGKEMVKLVNFGEMPTSRKVLDCRNKMMASIERRRPIK